MGELGGKIAEGAQELASKMTGGFRLESDGTRGNGDGEGRKATGPIKTISVDPIVAAFSVTGAGGGGRAKNVTELVKIGTKGLAESMDVTKNLIGAGTQTKKMVDNFLRPQPATQIVRQDTITGELRISTLGEGPIIRSDTLKY